MKCMKCNHVLPEDSEFCQYCGAKIEPIIESPVEKSAPIIAPSAPVTSTDFFSPELKGRGNTTPTPINNKSKQVQIFSIKKSNALIIILSIICLLLIVANVAQCFLHKKIVKDIDQQLVYANNIIDANNRNITKLQNTISSQNSTINSQNNIISSQKNTIHDLKEDSDHYNKIILNSQNKDFGYASSNFRASTGVIVVDKDTNNCKFTLTANWSTGGTVAVNFSSDAAWVEFDKNEWTTSTTMTVIPNYEGVSVVTFSNSVDTKTFSVLIIVTD